MIPDYLKLPPLLAIKLLKSRISLPIDYKGLDARLHDYAFMISGLMRADLLEDTKKLLLRSLEKGESASDFAENLQSAIADSGWSPTGKHVNTIFTMNINKSNWDGRKSQMTSPAMLKARPLWLFRHRDSVNFRKSHKALHNKAIAADHPFWKAIGGFPCDFNCFTPDTLVQTDIGWAKISSIRTGDNVVGGSGKVNPVTAIHRNWYVGKMIGIVGEKGFSTSSTPNHRFLTTNGWVKAENLKVGDILVKVPKGVSFDKTIIDIDQSNSLRSDIDMPFPSTAQGTLTKAFDPNIKARDVYVNPSAINMMTEKHIKPKILDMLNHQALAFSWLNYSVDMKERVFLASFVSRFYRLLFNFWIQERTRYFEFLGSSRKGVASMLGFSQIYMDVIISRLKFRKSNALLLFSSFIADPLGLNRIASMPYIDVAHNKEFSSSSFIDSPFFAQSPEGNFFDDVILLNRFCQWNLFQRFNIEYYLPHPSRYSLFGFLCVDKFSNLYDPVKSIWMNTPIFADFHNPLVQTVDSGVEGFSDGAPLSFFDSIDSFKDWAFSHCSLDAVVDVSHSHYNGFVLNLSVLNDESYTLQSATVHNCRCTAFPVTEEYCKRNGFEILTNPPDPATIAGKGFLRTSNGKTRSQIVKSGLARLSPSLRSQVAKQFKVKP